MNNSTAENQKFGQYNYTYLVLIKEDFPHRHRKFYALSADDATQTVDKLTALHDKSLSLLDDISNRQRPNVLKVFTYLEANPIIDIQKTAAALTLSYNTVAKAVALLQEKGILKQTDKAGKAKIYSYDEYLNILRKDT